MKPPPTIQQRRDAHRTHQARARQVATLKRRCERLVQMNPNARYLVESYWAMRSMFMEQEKELKREMRRYGIDVGG
jgi:site-specific recombinase XerD